MKDRTPKFPGRVKLKPVAGQTDTYDMTRADDPDDTGTPFNTRTMLQDSTGRFLRLPYANPLVDDAFRHMVDRIVPIGTIRTSPAQSLGDAWLKCDGSQVTFTEYPQLCQILKNTAGGVTWESTQVGVAPNFNGMSRPVLFKGKWYVAGAYKDAGPFTSNYTLNIASADNIIGPYTVIHTETMIADTSTVNEDGSVQMAATAETIAAVWDGAWKTGANSDYATFVTCSDDGKTWSTRAVKYNVQYASDISKMALHDLQTDGVYWAIAYDRGEGRSVYYITDIKNAAEWTQSKIAETITGYLSYTNGVWLIGARSGNKISIYAGQNPYGQLTKHVIGEIDGVYRCSQIAFYNSRYWVIITGNKEYVAFSTDLEEWTISEAEGLPVGSITELIANGRQMACAGASIFTTSDPDIGWNKVTLPEGAPTANMSSHDDILVSTGTNTLAYHDYSAETRLLPTISLSDDTTTFIKAKNELDVFESQQSGG